MSSFGPRLDAVISRIDDIDKAGEELLEECLIMPSDGKIVSENVMKRLRNQILTLQW